MELFIILFYISFILTFIFYICKTEIKYIDSIHRIIDLEQKNKQLEQAINTLKKQNYDYIKKN